MKLSKKSREKSIEEIATPHPRLLQKKTSVNEAGEKMRRLQADKFPVAAGNKLVGTVEGKFPDRKVSGFGHDPATTLVEETMSRQKIFCHSHDSIETALKKMQSSGMQHLPVVDGDLRVIGVLTLKDLKTVAKPRKPLASRRKKRA